MKNTIGFGPAILAAILLSVAGVACAQQEGVAVIAPMEALRAGKGDSALSEDDKQSLAWPVPLRKPRCAGYPAEVECKREGGVLAMKKLWDEFKAFAFKGNMIDLAVGVVIGAAFGTVIKSLVDNIMMSIVSYVAPATSYTQWHIGKVLVGKFLGDIVSFLTIAAAVFFVIVKIAGYLARRAVPPAEPTTKTCPLCLSVIPLSARKCSHCTANLEQDARALGASV